MAYFDCPHSDDEETIQLTPRTILKLRIFETYLSERKELLSSQARYWNRQDLLKALIESVEEYHDMLLILAKDLEETRQVSTELLGINHWSILDPH